MVLVFFKEAGIMLKLRKAGFFKNRVDGLVHVNKPGRLEVVNLAADALRELSVTTTATDLNLFLRLSNVFRASVPNCR